MTETWKPVPNFPYEVSDHGRVRRTEDAPHTQAGRVLKPQASKHRGLEVRLYRMGTIRGEKVQIARLWLVHRLVWTVFVGPIPERGEVYPKNGDKTDCRLVNLSGPGSVAQRPRVGA